VSDFNQYTKFHKNSCLADLDLLHADRWAGKHGQTNTHILSACHCECANKNIAALCQTVIYLIRTYAKIYVWNTLAFQRFLYKYLL
jgi:hypothetical protein